MLCVPACDERSVEAELIDARKEAPPRAGRHYGWLWMLSLFLVGLGAIFKFSCKTHFPYQLQTKFFFNSFRHF